MNDDIMELKIIGSRLKSLRKETSYSRREICRRYGLSENTLKCWELGESEMGALKLAKYLAHYRDFNIFVAADAILNTKSDFFLPSTATHNLNILTTYLKNLENSNTLFYVKPDGLIVYLNPQYKDLMRTNNLKKSKDSLPIYLQEVFESDYINKILHQPQSRNRQLITINSKQSNPAEKLVIELNSDFDIYNNFTGIAGFLLSPLSTNHKKNLS